MTGLNQFRKSSFSNFIGISNSKTNNKNISKNFVYQININRQRTQLFNKSKKASFPKQIKLKSNDQFINKKKASSTSRKFLIGNSKQTKTSHIHFRHSNWNSTKAAFFHQSRTTVFPKQNPSFVQKKHISIETYKKNPIIKASIDQYSEHAHEQSAVDCHFVSNDFLLCDKPIYQEPWYKRIYRGNNGSTHRSERIVCYPTKHDLVKLWQEYGQVKIHAINITTTARESLNALGSRFASDSFHCINVIKIFEVHGEQYILSFDPEANCGVSEIERIGALQLPSTQKVPELSPKQILDIQKIIPMFRIDKLSELIKRANFSHPESGLYIAKKKPWL